MSVTNKDTRERSETLSAFIRRMNGDRRALPFIVGEVEKMEAVLAVVSPSPVDEAKLRVRAMLKLKANRKGYVDIADRPAWSNGWEACRRASEYLSFPSSVAPGVTEAMIEVAAKSDLEAVGRRTDCGDRNGFQRGPHGLRRCR